MSCTEIYLNGGSRQIGVAGVRMVINERNLRQGKATGDDGGTVGRKDVEGYYSSGKTMLCESSKGDAIELRTEEFVTSVGRSSGEIEHREIAKGKCGQ